MPVLEVLERGPPRSARPPRAWWRSRWRRPGSPALPAWLAMLTMWPLRLGTIRSSASFVPKMTPWRLMSIEHPRRLVGLVDERADGMIPALLISTSIGPSSFSAASRKRAKDSRSVTSSSKATALPPSSGAVCSASARSRSPIATRAPRRISAVRRALADPAGAARDRHDLPRYRLDLLARHLRLLLLVEIVVQSSRTGRATRSRASEAQAAAIPRAGDAQSSRAEPCESRCYLRSAAARASATSARSRSESTRRCSSGEWANAPSGPRPSIAIGTWGAMLLASLAPPRGRADDRPAEHARLPARAAPSRPRPCPSPATAAAAPPVSATPSIASGIASMTGANEASSSARMSTKQLPGAGHDVDALARSHHRRDDAQRLRAGGLVAFGQRDGEGRRGRAGRCARASGFAPAWAAVPIGVDPDRRRRLAADDHGLLPVLGPLAALEAEAGVEVREAGAVGERLGPELLVVDEQQSHLVEAVGDLGERPEHAQREGHPALHVDR